MNDPKKPDEREAQPWHAADEKPAASKRRRGAPIGTHSLTGDPATVGIAAPAPDKEKAERSNPRDTPSAAEKPDPLAEPRANVGDGLLGPKR
jgi:hypothetical protein